MNIHVCMYVNIYVYIYVHIFSLITSYICIRLWIKTPCCCGPPLLPAFVAASCYKPFAANFSRLWLNIVPQGSALLLAGLSRSGLSQNTPFCYKPMSRNGRPSLFWTLCFWFAAICISIYTPWESTPFASRWSCVNTLLAPASWTARSCVDGIWAVATTPTWCYASGLSWLGDSPKWPLRFAAKWGSSWSLRLKISHPEAQNSPTALCNMAYGHKNLKTWVLLASGLHYTEGPIG